jgi:hypothetical protein
VPRQDSNLKGAAVGAYCPDASDETALRKPDEI